MTKHSNQKVRTLPDAPCRRSSCRRNVVGLALVILAVIGFGSFASASEAGDASSLSPAIPAVPDSPSDLSGSRPITGDAFSMVSGTIDEMVSGIFLLLFSLGGVEEPAAAIHEEAASPVEVLPEEGTFSEESGENALVSAPPGPDSTEWKEQGPAIENSTASDPSSGQEILITAAPTLSYGGIFVKSLPSGAAISIDGKRINADTPKVVFGLREGSHTVKISNENKVFSVTDQQVWVSRGIISRIMFDCSPAMKKSVEIRSDTYKGDMFTVNGKYPAFRIPSRVTIRKTASYLTILHNDSYLTREISDYLATKDAIEIWSSPVTFGRIQVRSDPAGADILVDGFLPGQKTPCIVENLSEGRHLIAVSMPGFLPDEKEITVLHDPSREFDGEVTLYLTPYGSGELSVKSTPPGASVAIDSISLTQETPCTFPYLTMGGYSMKVTSGEEDTTIDFEIAPGMVTEYECDFEKDVFRQRQYRI